MDYVNWEKMVRKAGGRTALTDPYWLEAQFQAGRSPRVVAEEIMSGAAPKKVYALPPSKMQDATPRVLMWALVVALILTAILVICLGLNGSIPRIDRASNQ